MVIQKSEIKIDELGFNNCPSRNELLDELAKYKVKYEAVDVTDKDYEQNANDTVVLAIPSDDLPSILNFVDIMHRWAADEFAWVIHNGQVIFRVWWD